MINDVSLMYECVSAIGNSLKLDEMLEEVFKTFILRTGGIGAQYIANDQATSSVSVGKEFNAPQTLNRNTKSFEIHEILSVAYVIDIALENGNLLFLYKKNDDLEYIGRMFSSFSVKLNNAIDACISVQQLQEHNVALKTIVEAEQKKNELNEQMMVNQSRMAVMGEMIGMIAHQWRQPITIIGMIANNTLFDIELEEHTSAKLVEDLNSINYQVRYLSETIDDFRNFFRPDKELQETSGTQLYADLLAILGNSMEQNNIKINCKGDCEHSFISYKNELVQVFLNIVSNAKDAFLENEITNREITIECTKQEDTMCFTLEDNAGGIPKDVVDHIFEPYFTTKPEEHGTGLGLYMSHTIVTNHLKGEIGVSTSSSGTKFFIRLPKLMKQKEL